MQNGRWDTERGNEFKRRIWNLEHGNKSQKYTFNRVCLDHTYFTAVTSLHERQTQPTNEKICQTKRALREQKG